MSNVRTRRLRVLKGLLPLLASLIIAGNAFAITLTNSLTTDNPLANSSCQTPTAKASFSPGDNAAYLWISVSNAAVNDVVEWRWFPPSNSLYATTDFTVTFSGSGCAWGGILINGQMAATLPGQWRVDLYLNGVLSGTANFTISGQPPLSAPTNMRFTLMGNTLTLQWDPVSGATDYKVWIGQSSGSYTLGALDAGSNTQVGPLNITGVPGGTYYLAAKAYTSTQESGFSNEITIPYNLLTAPPNLRFTLTGDNLTIQWDPVTGATDYKVWVGQSSGMYTMATLDAGPGTQIGPLRITGIPAGTYFLAAKAYNSNQQSGYSNEITVVYTPLPAPANMKYSLAGNLLTLQWDPVNGATDYKVWIGQTPGSYSIGAMDTGSVAQLGPLNVSGVPSGLYYLATKAYSATQESGYSNRIIVPIATSNAAALPQAQHLVGSLETPGYSIGVTSFTDINVLALLAPKEFPEVQALLDLGVTDPLVAALSDPNLEGTDAGDQVRALCAFVLEQMNAVSEIPALKAFVQHTNNQFDPRPYFSNQAAAHALAVLSGQTSLIQSQYDYDTVNAILVGVP